PIDRTRLMLEKSTCRTLVVDKESESQLSELLRGLATPMVILCPDRLDATEASAKLPGHSVVGADELVDAMRWRPPQVSHNAIAANSLRMRYLLAGSEYRQPPCSGAHWDSSSLVCIRTRG